MWPNRTLCDVLEEMRKAHKTHNYSYLPGLIEEAQHLGSKMEGALGDLKDIKSFKESWSKERRKLKTLREEITALENAKAELEGKDPKPQPNELLKDLDLSSLD
jgi:hypothetical protein